MNSNIQKSVLRIFAFPLWMIKRWQGYDELHDFNWSSKGLLYSWLWSTISKILCYWFLETYCSLVQVSYHFLRLTAFVFYGLSNGFILGSPSFLLYVNDMSKAVKCHLFLSLDDSCPFCQHNDINEIWKHLNLFFSNICNWLVGNKLSMHFGEDKRKSILFVSKLKRKNILKTDIRYRDIRIKQHANNVWRSSFT